jgi:asparagine synthase (glutamine-hydrolysing)
MCGIVGTVSLKPNQFSPETLERMNAAIRHRGPDEDGFYVGENVGLAMRRLAIIDLKCGRQPIFNSDKTKAIVFNGEIYNFQELRTDLIKRGYKFQTNSDTETIIHLYDEFGADCVQHLRGMFAFAIWDETDKSLFLARDRVGKKPLLYSHQPNGDLIFGSEFKALLAHPDVSREVDYEAIHHYLTLIYVPAPRTGFKHIRKLEPAHWLRWKNGKIETQKYWSLDYTPKIEISEEDAIEETTRILREATRLRMISDVPLGAFLSGGVDSSTVVALMAQENSSPVKTFSIGFEEQDFSELKYAKRVAEHVGAEYNEFIVKPNALEILPTLVEHYGEPYADPSALATYYVSRETRQFVTVALNGDGGDESFAGYERHFAMKISEKYHLVPNFLRKNLIESTAQLVPSPTDFRHKVTRFKRFLKAASLPRERRYTRWMSNFDWDAKRELYTENFYNAVGHHDSADVVDEFINENPQHGILDATLYADVKTYLPNDLLVKVDIASMAVSLEARSPFLDHKLMEFAARLPDNLKLKGRETKYLLKKLASRLVPPEVIYRQKMGFAVPINHWFRGEMSKFVADNLLSETAKKRGLFKMRHVENLINEHKADKQDNSWKLWNLLMLELWFQRFID